MFSKRNPRRHSFNQKIKVRNCLGEISCGRRYHSGRCHRHGNRLNSEDWITNFSSLGCGCPVTIQFWHCLELTKARNCSGQKLSIGAAGSTAAVAWLMRSLGACDLQPQLRMRSLINELQRGRKVFFVSVVGTRVAALQQNKQNM